MKQCVCDECEFYFEGYCASQEYGYDMSDCTAKSNADLMTEEEWEAQQTELYKKEIDDG